LEYLIEDDINERILHTGIEYRNTLIL
jgi:hypothetical protein